MADSLVAPVVRNAAGGWLSPAEFVRQLERRGPVFIKIGQFLALRPDIIPQEYSDELLKLLDHVAPFPWREARAILTEDLGAPPDRRFAYFNQTPIASASLAQVYMARTHGGDEVAVKVQRPGIGDRIGQDLKTARWLLRLLRAAGKATIVDRRELLVEFERWLREELDCARELANVRTMRNAVQDDERLRIPRPYPELSGPRVVTTEFLRGVPFSELLVAIREGRPEQIERWGFDRDRLATSLLQAVLTTVFRYRTFHADVHPGNVIALDADRIGFVDFGLVDILDDTIGERQRIYLAAVYRGDVEEMYRSLLEILLPSPDTDYDAFHGDFVVRTRAWLRERAAPVDGSRPHRSSIARYLIDLMRTVRQHRLRLPPDVLSMYRTFLTAETVSSQLQSDADLASVGRCFFQDLQIERTADTLMPDRLQNVAIDLLTLAQDAPRQLRRLLSDLADDRFVLRMHTSESSRDRREANARARLSALASLSVSLAVLIAAVTWRPLDGWPVLLPLWAALVLVYLLIAASWWKLR